MSYPAAIAPPGRALIETCPDCVGTGSYRGEECLMCEGTGRCLAAGLIDEYLLMIHPLVLGAGRRLFPAGVQVPLRLTGSAVAAAGVVLATYEPARD